MYKDKYFSILGDSISTLSGYNPPECAVFYGWDEKRLSGVFTPEDTWWGQVIDRLGGTLLVNHSWSGSTVCRHKEHEVDSYGCSDGRTGGLALGEQKPDVVMILLGLNDFGCGTRPTPADGEDGLGVFSVAYETMLQKIQLRYPQAEIWCLTLPRSFCSREPDYRPPIRRGGWHISEYCEVIRDCARKTGCRPVDIGYPKEPYDTFDGYHPNAAGMKAIAAAVLRALEKTTE